MIHSFLCASMRRIAAGFAVFGMVLALPSWAAVVIHGTRVVYSVAEPEVSIRLENSGSAPSLTQIWIDDGDAAMNATDAEVPFILTPPMARVDPGKSQIVRILYSGEALKGDQERLYWFNVLDIPPESSEQDTNKLQLAFRSRIKLFLRPAQMTEVVEDAPAKLSWKLRDGGSIEIYNGSKFHITFSAASVKVPSQELVFDDQAMLAPGQTMTVRLKQGAASTGDKVNFSIINDYGGQTKGESFLQ